MAYRPPFIRAHQLGRGKLSVPPDHPGIETGPQHGPGWGGPEVTRKSTVTVDTALPELDPNEVQEPPPEILPEHSPVSEDLIAPEDFMPQAYEPSPVDYDAEDRALEELEKDPEEILVSEEVSSVESEEEEEEEVITTSSEVQAHIGMSRSELEELAQKLGVVLPTGRWSTKKAVELINAKV